MAGNICQMDTYVRHKDVTRVLIGVPGGNILWIVDQEPMLDTVLDVRPVLKDGMCQLNVILLLTLNAHPVHMVITA
jgi:hypothetical protein